MAEVFERIESEVGQNPVMLYMKWHPDVPAMRGSPPASCRS